jgi:hypothetical protein
LFDFYHSGVFDMRWRDIRFEKPTEADGDSNGDIIQLLNNGRVCTADLNNMAFMVAWMPLSELPAFDPIPDPPEGWRFVEKGEAFDKRAKFWGVSGKEWLKLNRDLVEYPRLLVCIVPIDPPKPPEPQYRPFANAAEFEPYSTKLWRFTGDAKDTRRQSLDFNDRVCGGITWERCLANKVFADGSPFGVRVE